MDLMGAGTIQDYQDYMKCYSLLENSYKEANNNNIDGLLEAYCKFTSDNWDAAFPLLLNDGAFLPLNRKPSHIYLLPPLDSIPKIERLILCQFPEEAGENQSLRIVRWMLPVKENEKPTLEMDLGLWEVESKENISFVESVNEITFSELEIDEYMLRLHFEVATLRIIFSLESPESYQSKWIDYAEKKDSFFWHRSSHGKMERLLCVKQCESEDHWQDDYLLLPPEPRQTAHRLGHINGADSPQNSSYIYLASNNAYIYCIDKKSDRVVIRSQIFTGICRDVLCVPHPNDESRDTILSPCDDGSIWMLEKEGSTLTTLHYQIPPEKITRIVGFGKDTIVALDYLNRLIPMRVNQVDIHKRKLHDIRKFLWGKIYQKEKNNIQWDSTEYRARIARLTIAQYLAYLLSDTQIKPILREEELFWIETLFLDINRYDESVNKPSEIDNNFSIHEKLLGKIWSGLRALLYKNIKLADLDLPTKDWSPFWRLIKLDELAPDALWLNVFRHNDWVPLLIKSIKRIPKTDNKKLESVTSTLEIFIQEVSKKRKELNSSFSKYRSILVHSSMRLVSQPRHIREFDNQRFLICYINYKDGLHITKIPQGMHDAWEDVTVIEHKKYWNGIPRTLVTGDRLQEMFPDLINPIFIATNRGELRLLSISKKNPNGFYFDVNFKGKCPIEARTCHPVKHDGKYVGLMLGGKDIKRQASIFWLSFSHISSQNTYKPKITKLWSDSSRGGILRMLNVVGSADKQVLWATDRDLGELHMWPLNFTLKKRRWIPYLDGQKEFLTDQRGLQALAVDDYHNPTKLITGGKDGLALAYKYQASESRDTHDDVCLIPDWAIGCGKHLNRAIYLSNQKGYKNYWLLCSDQSDLQVINADTKKLESVIEYLGEVTAARRFKLGGNARAIIGTARGRIVQLFFNSNIRNSETKSQPLAPDFVLQTKHPETLALMSAFQKEMEELGRDGFPQWITRLTPTAQALCIRRLDWARDRQLIEKLLSHLWGNLEYVGEGEPICRLIAIMLVFAEKWRIEENHSPSDNNQTIYPELLQCLWTAKNKHACPSHFCQTSTLRVLRLGQAFRLFPSHQGGRGSPPFVSMQINKWLIDLGQMWHFSRLIEYDVDEESESSVDFLKRRLGNLLNEKIYFWPQEWQDWLNKIVAGNIYDTAPEPLDCLWLNNGAISAFNPIEMKKLNNLFESNSWKNWLAILQGILKQLDKETNQIPHIAWEEKGRLLQLKQQFDNGYKTFVDSNNLELPLVALFWANLSRFWKESANQKIANIDKSSASDSYIQLKYDMHWRDANSAQVVLTILNNSSINVTLESCRYVPYNISNISELEDGATVNIGADRYGMEREYSLTTPVNNKIQGKLHIIITDDVIGKTRKYKLDINKVRGIHQFRDASGFIGTDTYLTRILTEPDTGIRWLNGDYWSHDDREHILKTSNQLKISSTKITEMVRLSRADYYPNDILFCPDLPLSSTDPVEFTRRFHALLHSFDKLRFSRLALSLWHWVKPLPIDVVHVLGAIMIPSSKCNNLVNRLLDGNNETVETLKKGIELLDNNEFGAWCSGEPLNDAPEMNPPLASVLDKETWRKLIASDIADWPEGVTPEKLKLIRLLIEYESFNTLSKELVQGLASGLGEIALHSISGLWVVQNPVTVLEKEYKQCWLLPSGVTQEQILFLEKDENSLWLQLGKTKQVNSKGRVLYLEFLECLRLIFLPSARLQNKTDELLYGENKAYELLSGWAAIETTVDSNKIFKVENGLAHGAEIRHFVGRDKEVDLIFNILSNADNNHIGDKGIVILGSRRIGKTSLRQHIVSRFSFERLILDIDCSSWEAAVYSSEIIERKFFNACQTIINQASEDNRFSFGWRYLGNLHQRLDTHEKFEQFLVNYKSKVGHAVFLIFDETDILMSKGTKNIERLFFWLRSLMEKGLLAWMATGFPRGSSSPDCLQAQLSNGSSPIYNTMKVVILEPWSEDVSWRFLRSRLALLGIKMPSEYRDQVYAASQGLPWVIHSMGMRLSECQRLGRRSLISAAEWDAVLQKCNVDIRSIFETSIENAAKDIEKETPYHISVADRFSDYRLVRALHELALENAATPLKNITLSNIHSKLDNQGDRKNLSLILDSMTHLQVISGTNLKDTYQFTNGIYPRIVFNQGEEYAGL